MLTFTFSALKSSGLATVTLIAVVLLSSCSSDYLPFSGGALNGEVVVAPATWDAVADIDIIQLETNPEAPYSVNLWVAGMDNQLYVFAGDNRTEWVQNMEQNEAVRLGAQGNVYELRAQKVTDEDVFIRFSEVWKIKYGNYPRNMNFSEIYLYRLTRS